MCGFPGSGAPRQIGDLSGTGELDTWSPSFFTYKYLAQALSQLKSWRWPWSGCTRRHLPAPHHHIHLQLFISKLKNPRKVYPSLSCQKSEQNPSGSGFLVKTHLPWIVLMGKLGFTKQLLSRCFNFILTKFISFLMCMSVLPVCLCMCPGKSEVDVGFAGTGVTDHCEPPRGCWESNPSPLQKH